MNNEHAARVLMPLKGARFFIPRLVPLTLVAAFAVTDAALAQNTAPAPQVTVEAARVVKHTVGRSYTGAPIEELQLRRRVAYSDLDLSTATGQDAFKNRIKTTAREACKQLSSLYPLALWTTSNESCVKSATDDAMAQANKVIAAAH